ncbi:MAG: hypothetical protein QM674_06250 [Burkholderiaceae bacterium]
MRPTEKFLRRAVLVLAAVFSVAGIAFGAWISGEPVDGGRGGAIAVAITLVVYFLRHDLSSDIRAALTKIGPEVETALDSLEQNEPRIGAGGSVDMLSNRVDALEASSQIHAASDKKLNRAVAMASAIGTLTWGFGDWAVMLIQRSGID